MLSLIIGRGQIKFVCALFNSMLIYLFNNIIYNSKIEVCILIIYLFIYLIV